MRVHLGSDHAGLELKEQLLNWLADHGFEAVDHGPFVYDPLDDYPVFCLRAAEAAADEDLELARRIADSGASVEVTTYPGMIHGFWRHPQLFDAAEEALAEIAAFLDKHV